MKMASNAVSSSFTPLIVTKCEKKRNEAASKLRASPGSIKKRREVLIIQVARELTNSTENTPRNCVNAQQSTSKSTLCIDKSQANDSWKEGGSLQCNGRHNAQVKSPARKCKGNNATELMPKLAQIYCNGSEHKLQRDSRTRNGRLDTSSQLSRGSLTKTKYCLVSSKTLKKSVSRGNLCCRPKAVRTIKDCIPKLISLIKNPRMSRFICLNGRVSTSSSLKVRRPNVLVAASTKVKTIKSNKIYMDNQLFRINKTSLI